MHVAQLINHRVYYNSLVIVCNRYIIRINIRESVTLYYISSIYQRSSNKINYDLLQPPDEIR